MGSGPLDIEGLCERYGPMVLRRCRHLLRDEDEAMDVCQDVFVRVLERRDRLDASILRASSTASPPTSA